MRIGSFAQVQQLYGTQKKNTVQKQGKTSFADQVQISSLGKDIQVAKAAVANSPEVRADLTDSLKSQIQNGTYEVDSESFADKLLGAYYKAL